MSHKKEVKQQWVIEDRDELGQMGFKLPKRLPKGFVCNCDLAAYMLIDKLTERGYKVPGGVPLSGLIITSIQNLRTERLQLMK